MLNYTALCLALANTCQDDDVPGLPPVDDDVPAENDDVAEVFDPELAPDA